MAPSISIDRYAYGMGCTTRDRQRDKQWKENEENVIRLSINMLNDACDYESVWYGG